MFCVLYLYNNFEIYQKYYFQQNIKKEEDSTRRPKYKKLESTELITQNTSSEQRFRHFNNSKLQNYLNIIHFL